MKTERYSTETVITAIRKTKGMITVAAEELGCNPMTVRNYVARHASVSEALREERERMTDIAELSLYKKIQEGEGWAVAFYLRTQGKNRGYVERSEVTGNNGGPLQVEVRTIADLVKLATHGNDSDKTD